jgi:S1-C subfamily serine protease
MIAAAVAGLALLAQDPAAAQDPVAAARAAERERVATMARVAPAVCSVMPMGEVGGGSGVIFDPDGFLLTNFHCVARPQQRGQKSKDADPAQKEMKIGLPDGLLYKAAVLGIDPGSDLAVLRIEPRAPGQQFPFARLGDSDALLVGEAVFAMGNPFLLATDFTPTVTFGIVSGTHRYQGGGQNRFLVYPDCIQVDAPVNPGNSGGPLFNAAGEVVGINGRISVRDRGRVNVGVGFAIASNQIRNFLGDLMAGRHAEHGTLDMNAWYMKAPNEERRGVFVQGTFHDSLVSKLGVKLGDEVLAFNGAEVRSANQLATLVGVLPADVWSSLTFRPQLEHGYGAPRTITFRLPRLDTGSSRDTDRLATEEQRRLAAQALTRHCGAGEPAAAAASVELRTDPPVVVHRAGARLRIECGPLALVRLGPDDGFAVEAGRTRDLTPEERAKLERELACNPFLVTGAERKALVAGALLDGGLLAFQKPAYRFRLPGEGERFVFLHEDGAAAGYRYRDPVPKRVLEVSALGARARVVADGELVGDVDLLVRTGEPDVRLFERPGS